MAHPGGNITGTSADAGPEIWGKRVELLKEALPAISKVGFLASGRWYSGYESWMREWCSRAGASVVDGPLEAPFGEAAYRRWFSAVEQEGANALVVYGSSENIANRKLIIELAEQGRLPAIYVFSLFAREGGLMAYEFDLPETARHAAQWIDQILKGTKPGEIPIYQPTKFELTINLKTAKALPLLAPRPRR